MKTLFAMISLNIFRDFDSETKKLRTITINPPELYQTVDAQEDENIMLLGLICRLCMVFS